MRVRLDLAKAADGEVFLHRASERPLLDPRTHQHEELELNLALTGHGRVLCAGRWSMSSCVTCAE